MTDRDSWQADVAAVLSGAERFALLHGDALEVLAALPDNSLDAMVTDPPAGIAFMGREWDEDKGGREQWVAWLASVMREALRVLRPGAHAFVWALPRTSHWTAWALEQAGFEVRDCVSHLFGTGFPKSLNASKAIDRKLGTTDARAVVHSYTAGGNAGTSCADKGGTYVVGAPNSPAVELTITTGGSDAARRWDGWGTALKPAAEFWWLVRKPLVGTLADNLLAHGCGALHVDACRVSTDWQAQHSRAYYAKAGISLQPEAEKIAAPPGIGVQCHPGGRWPPHVVLSHADGCAEQCVAGCPVRVLGEQSGPGLAGGSRTGGDGGIWSPGTGLPVGPDYPGSGTAARFFPQFAAHPLDELPPFLYTTKPPRAERELGLEGLAPRTARETVNREPGSPGSHSPRAGAGRGAGNVVERCAVCGIELSGARRVGACRDGQPHRPVVIGERSGVRNVHPTCKSIALVRWLCKLVTPPGGVVLDVFLGSGTTAVACALEGFRCVGVERSNTEAEPYLSIARARLRHVATWHDPVAVNDNQQPKQMSLFR